MSDPKHKGVKLAAPKIPKQQKEPATPLRLGTEYMEMFQELLQLKDTDTILREAGKTRADLQNLLYDDEIYAAVQTRQAALASCVWSFPDKGDKRMNAILDKWYDRFVEGIHRAILFGYSVIQVVYHPRKEEIVEVIIEDLENFKFTKDGKLISRINGKDVDVLSAYPTKAQPSKFFLFVHRPDSKNYMGEALLSRAYWPWFFRVNSWKFWVRWLERFSFPWRVGKTTGSTQAMAEQLLAAAQDAVLAIGADDDVSILNPAATSDPFDRINVALEKRIQKLILGQTLTTDASKASYAAAKIHELVRQDRLLYDIGFTQPNLQKIIDWIADLYSLDVGKISIEPLRSISKDRAERDAMMFQYGVLPALTRDYFLKNYDYTDEDLPPEEYFLPDRALGGSVSSNVGAQGVDNSDQKMYAKMSASERTPLQRKIDKTANGLMSDLAAALETAETKDDVLRIVSEKMRGEDFKSKLTMAVAAIGLLGLDAADRNES